MWSVLYLVIIRWYFVYSYLAEEGRREQDRKKERFQKTMSPNSKDNLDVLSEVDLSPKRN